MSRNMEQKGIALIEILVAVAIALGVILLLVPLNTFYVKTSLVNVKKIKATYLVEEGVEAVKYLRDVSFADNLATLTLGTPYQLHFDGTMWQSTTTNQYIDNFYLRIFTLSSVNRDGNDNIATTGTSDPDTFKLVVSVSFPDDNGTTTKSLTTYVNDLFQN